MSHIYNRILWDSSCHHCGTVALFQVRGCGGVGCSPTWPESSTLSLGDEKGNVFRRRREEWDLNLIGGKYCKSSTTFARTRSWFRFSLALNVFITLTRVPRPLVITQDLGIVWCHPQLSTCINSSNSFYCLLIPCRTFSEGFLCVPSSQFLTFLRASSLGAPVT